MSRTWVMFVCVVVTAYMVLAPVVLASMRSSRVQTHITVGLLYMPCCVAMGCAAAYFRRRGSRLGFFVCLTLALVAAFLAWAIQPVLAR